MRILHFSDNHGRFFPNVSSNVDVVVCSGDFLPNSSRDRKREVKFQYNFIIHHVDEWVAKLGGKPFVKVPGNHDFTPVCDTLRQAGANAFDLYREGPRVIDGVRFSGFPHIPWMGGEWNFECADDEANAHLLEALDCNPDVLVAHAPPYGILDGFLNLRQKRMDHCGWSPVTNRMMYGEGFPSLYLCGHNHDQGGQAREVAGVTVINAATTAVLLDFDPKKRTTVVLDVTTFTKSDE